MSPFARINSSRSLLLYLVIAAVLVTLIAGAGAAIATHDSGGERAHSAPASVSYSLDIDAA
ncbi:hypothetical protein [Nocardia jinanensis]|uniref:hypothetical protein n=1 Tax=Nocardia jinanensis TaxID=382504 RepID=UPI0012E343FF|nr:hypothetical protein [Nocardia jinanensis]